MGFFTNNKGNEQENADEESDYNFSNVFKV